MKTIQKAILCGAVLLAAAGDLVEAANRDVKVRVLTVAGREPGDAVFLHDLAANKRGEQVTVRNQLNLQFDEITLRGEEVAVSRVAGSEGRIDADKLLGKVTVPEGAASVLLVIYPLPENKLGLCLVDDTAKAFPDGSVMLINRSDKELRVTLEKEDFDLEAASAKVIDPPEAGPRGMEMYNFFKDGDKWTKFGAGTLPNLGERRLVQIYFISPRTKRVEMKGFNDSAPPEEE